MVVKLPGFQQKPAQQQVPEKVPFHIFRQTSEVLPPAAIIPKKPIAPPPLASLLDDPGSDLAVLERAERREQKPTKSPRSPKPKPQGQVRPPARQVPRPEPVADMVLLETLEGKDRAPSKPKRASAPPSNRPIRLRPASGRFEAPIVIRAQEALHKLQELGVYDHRFEQRSPTLSFAAGVPELGKEEVMALGAMPPAPTPKAAVEDLLAAMGIAHPGAKLSAFERLGLVEAGQGSVSLTPLGVRARDFSSRKLTDRPLRLHLKLAGARAAVLHGGADVQEWTRTVAKGLLADTSATNPAILQHLELVALDARDLLRVQIARIKEGRPAQCPKGLDLIAHVYLTHPSRTVREAMDEHVGRLEAVQSIFDLLLRLQEAFSRVPMVRKGRAYVPDRTSAPYQHVRGLLTNPASYVFLAGQGIPAGTQGLFGVHLAAQAARAVAVGLCRERLTREASRQILTAALRGASAPAGAR